MNFIDFAAMHGLRIVDLISDNRWHRCSTEGKPKKKNGAYVFDGSRGAVIDFAGMTKAETFRDGVRTGSIDRTALRSRMVVEAAAEKAKHSEASAKAQRLLDSCVIDRHPYLARKGFPDAFMPVTDGMLVIPMREYKNYRQLNSAQTITADGEKKFMFGGKAKGSVYIIGPRAARERWLVEGFATALSVRLALETMYRDVEVITCFSAGNLAYIGRLEKMRDRHSFVFADHDKSGAGAKAAEETGLPWVMAPEEQTDANDVHVKQGVHALVKIIRAVRQQGIAA